MNTQTTFTLMNPIIDLLMNKSAAGRTDLACVPGVYQHNLSTSLFRFVEKYIAELPPANIRYRLSEPVILNHAPDIEILNCYEPIGIYEFPCELMMKIFSAIRDFSVCPLEKPYSLCSSHGSFYSSRDLLLSLNQLSLTLLKMPWIFDNFSPRGSYEVFKAKINSNFLVRIRKFLSFYNSGKYSEPPASLKFDTDSFYLSFKQPVEFDLDMPYLGKPKPAILKHEAALRIGEAVVSTLPLKSRIAWNFTLLRSSKERFKRLINFAKHILKALGMNIVILRKNLFYSREFGRLPVKTDRNSMVLPHPFPLLNRTVIQVSAKSERFYERLSLFFGRVYSIFEGFAHLFTFLCLYIFTNSLTRSPAHSSPTLKCGVF